MKETLWGKDNILLNIGRKVGKERKMFIVKKQEE